MELFLWILAIGSGIGILHTYLIYPFWVMRKADRMPSHKAYYNWVTNEVARSNDQLQIKQDDHNHSDKNIQSINSEGKRLENQDRACYFVSQNNENWPSVSVLMAVHNEEKVLEEKLKCLLEQDYPGQYQIYIGSDNSTDATNQILEQYASKHPILKIKLFRERQGKPGIINQLKSMAPAPSKKHFYLLTDASVMLAKDVVTKLISPSLSRPDLSLMDARMTHTGIQKTGISKTEDQYIGREVRLKQAEGKIWGYMIGPFGGCFALRSDHFIEVPDNFLVDDFFLCLASYEQGGHGISVPDAHCYEGVGQKIQEEFRRKVRISSGNWQNAIRFSAQWWPPNRALAFAFFSHKILRWLTPFLLLLLLISLAILCFGFGNYWGKLAFYSLVSLLTIPALTDQLLSRLFGIHWQILRAIRYFLAMNLALLVGFFRFLNGIQSNVWQPTQRH